MATLESLVARRDAYLAAELKILQSQEYQTGQGGNHRRNRRAELEQVQAGLREVEAQIAATQAQTSGARRVYNNIPASL